MPAGCILSANAPDDGSGDDAGSESGGAQGREGTGEPSSEPLTEEERERLQQEAALAEAETFTKGEIQPAHARVAGIVVHASTGEPVGNIEVAIGELAETTDTAGTFEFDEVPIGRHVATIEGNGYLPVSHEFGIARDDVTLDLELAPVAEEQTVGDGAMTLAAGPTGLTISPGTFDPNTQLTATWLTGSAMPGPPVTIQDPVSLNEPYWPIDPDGNPAPPPDTRIDDASLLAIVGVLHVDASAQPKGPLELVVPAQAGQDPNHLRLLTLHDNDSWAEADWPVRVQDENAVFEVWHFSDYAVGVPYPAQVHGAVTFVRGTVWILDGDGKRPLKKNDPVPIGSVVTTEAKSVVRFVSADGSVFTMGENSEGIVFDCSDGEERKETLYELARGKLRILHNSRRDPNKKLTVRTRSGGLGVRGTVLSVDVNGASQRVDVSEGEVESHGVDGTLFTIRAGEFLAGCPGCGQPLPSQVCVDTQTLDAGISVPDAAAPPSEPSGGCAEGVTVRDIVYYGDMVSCFVGGFLSQCEAAERGCAPGWHLCTRDEYIRYGGRYTNYRTHHAPSQQEVGHEGWLAHCIAGGGASHSGVCDSCDVSTTTERTLGSDCGDTPGGDFSTAAKYVGMTAKGSSNSLDYRTRIGGRCAYWYGRPASGGSATDALCCKNSP